MYGLKSLKQVCNSQLIRGAVIVFAATMFALSSTSARAECGNRAGYGTSMSPRLLSMLQARTSHPPSPNAPIVGLWHVTYTSGGEEFYEAFDQWHSDGNEFEMANLPPEGGNVCMGFWEKLGPNTVQLAHVGWGFSPDGSSLGVFTIAETNTVSSDGNSYEGTFDFKQYDIDGNVLQEVTGTLSATRISVE